jgi:hypothetical protein
VLKKIAIVAERAAGAGLTEDAGFPMMKNPVVGRWSFVVGRSDSGAEGWVLANDQGPTTSDGFSYAHCLP